MKTYAPLEVLTAEERESNFGGTIIGGPFLIVSKLVGLLLDKLFS